MKWEYGIDQLTDDASNIEIKVFGIEMVYVNQGALYVGDGISSGRFWDMSKTIGELAYISDVPIIPRCAEGMPHEYDDDLLRNNGVLVDGDEGI